MISSVRSILRIWRNGLKLRQRLSAGGRRLRKRPAAAGISSVGAVQSLEDRVLLSTITVTTGGDPSTAHSGTTLRDAITQANAAPGPDTIVFNSSLNGTAIKLTGELDVTGSLTIHGNGATNTQINGQSLSRVLNVTGVFVDLSLENLTVTAGKTTADLQSGAGINFLSVGALTVLNSTISGNTTTGIGSMGAGIYAALGSVTVINSTISGNKTTGAIAAGGGIYSISGAVTLTNSTLTGNSTSGEQAFGAGICSAFADITLESSTLAKNSTTGTYSSGGGIYSRSGAVTLTNSILALNTVKSGGFPDIFSNSLFGATFSANHSLIGNRQGLTIAPVPVGATDPTGNGNLVGASTSPIDPKLGILASNGGPTQTLALLSTSPAIDHGGTTTLALDQRGFVRVVNATVDMGAYEFGASAPVGPNVSLSISPANMAEAGGQSTVTATLSAVSTLATTINLGFAGTATNPGDYTRSGTQIVVPAGQLTGTITLTAVQDTVYEGNETVTVNIASVVNGFASGGPVTGTVVDDDSAPTVSLSLNSANMAEAAGQSTVTATLSAVSGLATTVNLGFSGTATNVSDYTRSATQIVIPAGQLTGTVTLTAAQDLLSEGNETVVVSMSSVVNGTASGGSVTATIVDDDVSSLPTASLSLSAANLAEAGGQSTVTATLSAVSSLATTINLGFAGTATNVSDYTRSAAQIVIPAGQLTRTITLTAAQDTLYEGNETVIVSIASVVNGTAGGTSVTATIVDDDSAPTVSLSLDTASMAEAGGQSTVSATLSAVSAFATTVNLGFAGTAGGSDYTASATQIVIPAGQLTGSATLTAAQDTLYEGNETVIVSIASVMNGTAGGTSVTATIVDDDSAPTVSLSLDTANMAEAGGQSTVTATLSAVSAFATTVNLGFAGTAGGSDYTASATQIVIPAGQLTGTITLTAAQDALYEGNESVIASIASVVNGTAGGTSVTATIVDDDTAPTVSLSLDTATLAEAGGQSVVTATLSAVSGLDTTITLGFSGTAGGSDYTASATQIVIPAGQLTGSVTLTAVQDTLVEGNETVVVSAGAITNGTAGSPAQVTATIVDDDAILPTVTLSIKPAKMAETGGQSTITATLSEVTTVDVVVDLQFSGTATGGDDYVASAGQIVILAGQTKGTMTLTAVQDSVFEGNETVIVGIAGVTNAVENGAQSVTATITEDDAPPSVVLSASESSIVEGGQTVLTATLSTVSPVDTTVTLVYSGTATKGVDYNSALKIVIPAGELSASIILKAKKDSLVEGPETVVIDISKMTNGRESGNQLLTLTIDDDMTLFANAKLSPHSTDSVFSDPNSVWH